MLPHFLRQFHFDHWASLQVAASLRSCPEMPDKAVSLMSHYLLEQWFAHDLLTNGIAANRSDVKEFSFDECVMQIGKLEAAWKEYLSDKSDNYFETSFEYTNAVGRQTQRVVSDLLTDIVDHATYHRGQIAMMVRQAGGEPAKTWFTRWVKETGRGTK